jgi:hypothetical protein
MDVWREGGKRCTKYGLVEDNLGLDVLGIGVR